MKPTYAQLRAKLDELLASGQISINEHVALKATLVAMEQGDSEFRFFAERYQVPEALAVANDLPTSDKDL